MHVLLTNDDGPLHPQQSPYITYLISKIVAKNWTLSIIVPHKQRSWIGKAHLANKTLTATYIYTSLSTPQDFSFLGPFDSPQPNLLPHNIEWVLVDGTPASCADLGVHHLFTHKGPVDLVISGPNYGKNSSALYSMSSGTIGAAFEASLSGTKAIALSYAYDSVITEGDIVDRAASLSIELIDHLYKNWPKNANFDIYSINVPLVESIRVGKTKIFYAPILQNQWGSIFRRLDADDYKFKWSPNFKHVDTGCKLDLDHSDSRVLLNEGVSVTPLKATFKEADITGEIILDVPIPELENLSKLSINEKDSIVISIPKDSYIYPALESALFKNLPNIKISNSLSVPDKTTSKTFQYGEYEQLNFDKVISDPTYLINSYVYRKALIRKHYLTRTIHTYTCKNPTSVLHTSFPKSYDLEVDYAEFLDESLDDAYELRDEIENSEKTWILKPSMSDRGQGIRLFRSIEQLKAIFDSFEEDSDGDEDEDGNQGENGVITSQLRHFVVQEYQENPILLPAYNNKKFHIRCYVVCNGSLKVSVYKKMLTLFSLSPFAKPTVNDEGDISLYGHLTNTCLQGEESIKNNSVVEFWELEGVSDTEKDEIFNQICKITKELFKSALNIDRMNFQPLPNAFEIYGLDFLINDDLNVNLLEVNAYPDFKQTGNDLKQLIYGLFDGVVKECVVPFFTGIIAEPNEDLVEVLDQSTSGAW